MASAHSLSCDIFYVDFECYDRWSGDPEPLSEFLARLPNPAEIYSVADRQRLISLTKSFQFGQAFEELLRILENVKKNGHYFADDCGNRLERVGNTLRCLQLWDDYRYRDAQKFLTAESALSILGQLYENGAGHLSDKQLYKNKNLCAYYLLDSLGNALRRKSQGQLQDAFLRLAVLIEFVLMLWEANNLPECIREKYTKPKKKTKTDYLAYGNLIKILHRFKFKPNIINNVETKDLYKIKEWRNKHVHIHEARVYGENVVEKAECVARTVVENLLVRFLDFDLEKLCEIRKNLCFDKFVEKLEGEIDALWRR